MKPVKLMKAGIAPVPKPWTKVNARLGPQVCALF